MEAMTEEERIRYQVLAEKIRLAKDRLRNQREPWVELLFFVMKILFDTLVRFGFAWFGWKLLVRACHAASGGSETVDVAMNSLLHNFILPFGFVWFSWKALSLYRQQRAAEAAS